MSIHWCLYTLLWIFINFDMTALENATTWTTVFRWDYRSEFNRHHISNIFQNLVQLILALRNFHLTGCCFCWFSCWRVFSWHCSTCSQLRLWVNMHILLHQTCLTQWTVINHWRWLTTSLRLDCDLTILSTIDNVFGFSAKIDSCLVPKCRFAPENFNDVLWGTRFNRWESLRQIDIPLTWIRVNRTLVCPAVLHPLLPASLHYSFGLGHVRHNDQACRVDGFSCR